MKLSEYFKETAGRGIMATADASGKVNVAVYSRPHFLNEETVAFIMADRFTHNNLQENPYAAYLFMESSERYIGKRLYLKKTREEKDSPMIGDLRRRKYPQVSTDPENHESRYLVFFRVEKTLPLIGDGQLSQ